MNKREIVLAVSLGILIFVTLAISQTTSSQPWTGLESQQMLANCVTHNSDTVVCVATDGVAFSFQGAAFVQLSGATGPAGPAGPQGPAATVTVGTVTTSAAGSQASVTNTGNAQNAVLNFTIPQGATGGAGPAGPVQSFNSLSCGTSSQSNSGLSASSCKETTP